MTNINTNVEISTLYGESEFTTDVTLLSKSDQPPVYNRTPSTLGHVWYVRIKSDNKYLIPFLIYYHFEIILLKTKMK